jgi:hypothetical protein
MANLSVRNAAIRNRSRAARQQFKRNINNVANAQFGTNANLQRRINEAGFLEGENYNSAMNLVQMNRIGKNSFRNEAVSQLRRTLRNAALAENARLYQEAKTVLGSEEPRHRQTVLKISALDDMMVSEREKLAIANTNEKARTAATKLYNIELLKDELDEARHASRVPTAEQNARYNALVQGFNFNGMNTSIYRRLRNNNANLTRKNKAATKIQALTRGVKGRKTARALKAARNAPPAPNFMVPPMVHINVPAQPQGQLVGGPGAVNAPRLTPAQMREARLAALAKRGV